MGPRSITLIALLVLSEVVGVLLGEWFFRLYLSTVPPMAQTQFTANASRAAYYLYGAGAGLVLFAWALIGMAAGGMMRRSPKAPTASR